MDGVDVDPPRLAAAGANLASHGDELATALAAFDSALAGSGQMCGDDPAGKAFALSYRQGGQALFSATEAAVGACRNAGYGVQVTACNYAHSEAASTVGGGEVSVPTPVEPAKFTGPTMPDPLGPPVGQPLAWLLVSQWVGSPWPDGNPATLRAAASTWRGFASTLDATSRDVGAGVAQVSGQDIPELGKITGAIGQISSGVQDLGRLCVSIAASLEDFAAQIEASQEAIRDLLHRLSASRIASTVGGIFTGHNPMDDVRAVANDIREILHTLQREADGVSTMFDASLNALDQLTTQLEGWARREFTHFLGEDVGGAVADLATGQLDLSEGALKSVLETVGGIGHLATHPQDLVNLVEEANPLAQAMNFAHDPKGFIDGKIATVKGLVDAKDWTSDHPLRGLGHNAGTIAQFLVPGLGEAKGGATVGRVAEEAGQAARVEGEAARAGVGLVRGGVGSDVAAQGTRIGHDLAGVEVKPAETGPMPAPVRPVEPGPAVKPADPGPVRAPVESPAGPRGGEGAPVAPGADGGAGGGVHEPGASPAEGAGPAPGVGVHEPAPVGERPETSGPPVTSSGQVAEPGAAGAHAPQSESAVPTHEPMPGAFSDGVQPPETAPHGAEAEIGGHGDGGGHGIADGDGGAAHSPVPEALPEPLPPDSPLFDGYTPVEPGPEFTTPEGKLVYPDDSLAGKPYAIPGTIIPSVDLAAGTEIGRFGYPGGSYMAPEGTPFAGLSLPPDSALKPYFRYIVADPEALPPGWRIEQSQAAPWFHQPGGATQFRIIAPPGEEASVQMLEEFGYLKRVHG